MRQLRRYIDCVRRHWKTTMTGLGALAISIIWAFWNARVYFFALAIFGFFCLIVAGYQTWLDEHRLRVTMQKKLIMRSCREKIHGKNSLSTAALAEYAMCSQRDVLPALEELVDEKWMSKGAPGNWSYNASVVFSSAYNPYL